MLPVNYTQQAKIAIRSGNLVEARKLLRQSLREDPQNHITWLLLARATPDPKAALAYVQRAAAIRPDSQLVYKEFQRLKKNESNDGRSPKRPYLRSYILLGSALTVLIFLIVWLAPMGFSRVLALMEGAPVEIAEQPIIIIPIATRSQRVVAVTPEPILLPTPTGKPAEIVSENQKKQEAPELVKDGETDIQSSEPDILSEEIVQNAAAENPLEEVLQDPETETTDQVTQDSEGENLPETEQEVQELVAENNSEESTNESEEINLAEEAAPVEETINEEVAANEASEPTVESNGFRPSGVSSMERWIDVNLSTQTLVAYEGDSPVFNTLVSSGMWNTPTVTGQFRTTVKYESQDMNGYLLGYDYYLQDVPYVMYFYNDYAIHGTYWHNNFGTPMSHGCVNVSTPDASWLYDWAPVGTTVNIHY